MPPGPRPNLAIARRDALIRARLRAGESPRRLAADYGLTRSRIGQIRRERERLPPLTTGDTTMQTLKRDAQATLIHGQTGQEIEDTMLPAGTEYTIESVMDGRVARWVTILTPTEGEHAVNGWYRYRVLETAL